MKKEKLHIITHDYQVDREKRAEKYGHQPRVIWFTGLSGSGKSTLANRLEAELFERGIHTYILDGDNVRTGLNKDLDFTPEGRVENIRRIAEVANLMKDAGLVVLSAFVSPYAKDREQVKNIVGADYFTEVFVNCPVEVCEQRDVKGLYKKARAGEISNFTGISAPFEAPTHPDVEVKTHEVEVEEGVKIILDQVINSL